MTAWATQDHRHLHSTSEVSCCPPGLQEQGSFPALLPTRALAFLCSPSVSRFPHNGKGEKCHIPSVSEWMMSTNCASVGSSLSLGGFPLYKGPAGSRPAMQNHTYGIPLVVCSSHCSPWTAFFKAKGLTGGRAYLWFFQVYHQTSVPQSQRYALPGSLLSCARSQAMLHQPEI